MATTKTNQELIDMWLNKLENMNNKSKNTIKSYRSQLKSFSNFINKPFAEVECEDIENFLSSPGEKSTTKQHKQTVICRFYNWMYDHKYCDRHPKLERESFSKETRNHKFLEKEQWEVIKNYLYNECHNTFNCSSSSVIAKGRVHASNATEAKLLFAKKHKISSIHYVQAEEVISFVKDRDYAMVSFMINSGLRSFEILKLKVENFNINQQEVTVIGKGNKQRTVQLNAFTIKAISNYISKYQLTEYVFPNRSNGKLSKPTMDLLFSVISEKTGIAINPHMTRHTYGQNEYDRGVSLEIIQKQMGHSSGETTKIYAQIRNRQVKDAVNL